MTVSFYAFVVLGHTVSPLGVENCPIVYVRAMQFTMFASASGGFFPAVFRLFEKDLRHRVAMAVGLVKAPDQMLSETNQWAEETSFAIGGYDVPVVSLSNMNYSGIFKSISAKVSPIQFIIDSVGALTYLFRTKLADNDNHSDSKRTEAIYDFSLGGTSFLGDGLEKHLHMVDETIRVIEYLPNEFQSIRDSNIITEDLLL